MKNCAGGVEFLVQQLDIIIHTEQPELRATSKTVGETMTCCRCLQYWTCYSMLQLIFGCSDQPLQARSLVSLGAKWRQLTGVQPAEQPRMAGYNKAVLSRRPPVSTTGHQTMTTQCLLHQKTAEDRRQTKQPTIPASLNSKSTGRLRLSQFGKREAL